MNCPIIFAVRCTEKCIDNITSPKGCRGRLRPLLTLPLLEFLYLLFSMYYASYLVVFYLNRVGFIHIFVAEKVFFCTYLITSCL